MSIVGPRPVVREELAHYRKSSARLLSVRPGITGLWQVERAERHQLCEPRPRSTCSTSGSGASGWIVSILFRTLPNVLVGRGAC